MKKAVFFSTVLLVASMSCAFAAGVPEGAIWDHRGTNLFGDSFQTSLMINHGDLVIVLSKGEQIDYGSVVLNSYNEYQVPPSNFKSAFPAIGTMTFKFSPDFSSVQETDIMNYGNRCVAGDCANNIETIDYQRR